jgi:hypothetical protein
MWQAVGTCLLVTLMVAASSSEMSVNFYQMTECNILEDGHLHPWHRENLRSHLLYNSLLCAELCVTPCENIHVNLSGHKVHMSFNLKISSALKVTFF